jgi:2,4-dienoyl-CoA reductase-like NADH-dependent reductase (Old Yellow Enzyme family)/NADPH-dependent 2,4-dienoyl-CoA reductase/sulfur reductase-like enzyme
MEEFSRNTPRKTLFQPGFLGTVKTRNRILMAPMATNLAGCNGEVTDDMLHYYCARSKGGVGAIIVENTCVEYPRGSNGAVQLRIDKDLFLPGLGKLAESIQRHGARAIVQLNHAGGNTTAATAGVTPVAPSVVSYRTVGSKPRELEKQEIALLVDSFVSAAVRVHKAGFDGAEIHGGHAYLVAQFLSPAMNLRTDEYGGTTEKRSRFAREIVRGIRELLGNQFALLFRISGDEFLEGGRTIEETIAIVKALEADGVDAFHVTGGTNRFNVSSSRARMVETPYYPEGWKTYLAAAVKKETTKPVIAVGVIRTPDKAAEIIETGQADFVALGRGLLADPAWVQKAVEGRDGLIARCISCGEGCSKNRTFLGRQIRCALNPLAGRESHYQNVPAHAAAGKKLAVIGGGPAGMTAAVWGTRLGCRVELFERADELGGQLLLAKKPPGKEKIAWVIEHLKTAVEHAGINCHLSHPITPGDVALLAGFDAVIVATGSVAGNPGSYDLDRAVSSDDFLARPETYLGVHVRKVVVSGGGMVACELALMIRERGPDVVLVTRKNAGDLAPEVEPLTRFELLHRLTDMNVVVKETIEKRECDEGGLRIEKGGRCEHIAADLTIAATPRRPRADSLTPYLEPHCARIFSIGDSVKVGNILDAVHDGFHAAMRLIDPAEPSNRASGSSGSTAPRGK